MEKRLGLYSESKNDSKKPEESQINILDKLNLYQALKLAKKNLKDGLSKEAKGIYQDILKKFPKNKKASESYNYNPSSPYSASKASADQLVRSYGRTYGIKVLIANPSL